MKKFPIILLLLISLKGIGQNVPTADIDTTKKYSKIMIVPFEHQMYLCDVQSSLAAVSKKNHQQIVQFFRYGIASELQNKFLYLYNTSSLIHIQDTMHDLERTYAAVRYKFEVYEEEPVATEEPSKKKSLFPKKKKKTTSSSKKGKIKNGQLVSTKSLQTKYASLLIKKKEVLTYLEKKYATDLFVFVTELDIQNDISDQTALASNKYIRHLRLHYAIVDSKGNFISKGVVSTSFPNTVNDIQVIKDRYFPILAKKLAAKLPPTPKADPVPVDPLEKITPAK